VLTTDTKLQINYFIFDWLIYIIFVLNMTWKVDYFQIMIFVYISSTWSIVKLVTRFETWITRNYVNDVSSFHVSYLITLMAYLFSQWTRKVQINYFIFKWSISRLFVLHTAWKRDSLKIMIFVNVCSTYSMVQQKRFLSRE
jgi:hypothetical protein